MNPIEITKKHMEFMKSTWNTHEIHKKYMKPYEPIEIYKNKKAHEIPMKFMKSTWNLMNPLKYMETPMEFIKRLWTLEYMEYENMKI